MIKGDNLTSYQLTVVTKKSLNLIKELSECNSKTQNNLMHKQSFIKTT